MDTLEAVDQTISDLRRRLDEQEARVETFAATGEMLTQEEAALGMLGVALAEALVHRKVVASGRDGF